MRKTKLLAVLSMMLLLTFVVVGCTQNSSSPSQPAGSSSGSASTPDVSSEVPEEPLPAEITIFTSDSLNGPSPAPDTPVGKKIEEITGTKLTIEYLVGQDIQTKANLMVAGGVYPDMIHSGEGSGVFITAEALLPLEDLIEQYGPNIKKIYRPKELELAAMTNGALYVLPTNRPTLDNLYPGAGYYLAYNLLEEFDFPIPKNITEYGQLIKDYMDLGLTYEGQPLVGFTFPTEGSRSSAFEYGASRYLSGFPNDGVTQVDQDTLEATIVMKGEANKIFLEFANDLWNGGYMDKEVFMQKNDQYLAKIASGRTVAVYDQRWGLLNGIQSLEAAGLYDRSPVAFPITTDDAKGEYYRGPYAIAVQGISISTSAKDPEGVMRYWNRFAADDIQKMVFWGIEGEDYSYDANGNFVRTSEQWANSFNIDYFQAQGFGSGSWMNFMPRREAANDETYGKFDDGNWVGPAMQEAYADERYSDVDKQILEAYNISTLCDFFEPSYPARYQPGWSVRTQIDRESEAYLAVDKALALANEWHAKIIQAKPADFEKLYNEYYDLLLAVPGLSEYEKEATRLIQESAQYYG